jgi:6-phosphogluconate dehydrogenase
MSTIRPAAARAIASRLLAGGIDFLDAPVSGGEVGAIAGTLSIMVGGSSAAFDRAAGVRVHGQATSCMSAMRAPARWPRRPTRSSPASAC